MRVIGVIPARYGSTRFPGKPLIEIAGKTMIRRVYEQAKMVQLFAKVIVATDHHLICNEVENFGGDVMMTASTHQSGTDRCGEVLETLEQDFDVVINIQGDEPFIQSKQLELLIKCFENKAIQIATLVKKIENESDLSNQNCVKVVFDSAQKALYFSRSTIPFAGAFAAKNVLHNIDFYKHIGIYGYTTATLHRIIKLPQSKLEKAESLEQLRWLENGFSIEVVETILETISIDTPQDLQKIK